MKRSLFCLVPPWPSAVVGIIFWPWGTTGVSGSGGWWAICAAVTAHIRVHERVLRSASAFQTSWGDSAESSPATWLAVDTYLAPSLCVAQMLGCGYCYDGLRANATGVYFAPGKKPADYIDCYGLW
jgi:hypothetical protein